MKNVILDKNLIIGQGGEKIAYLNPNDKTKILKIPISNNKINILEDKYMTFLQKNCKSFEHLPKYYGKCKTNLGEALSYELIRDFDDTISKSFKYYMANRLISYNLQKELINQLEKYIIENDILFIDNDLHNIFCQKVSPSRYKLIMIDGLGAKRLGLKFWLYRNSKLFTKYKIRKQWKKLLYKYKQDRKVINLIDDSFKEIF